ncbi:hypothetical protein ACT54M_16670 [Leptospira santarosai]|nr:hypothetical protein [Leptospira santarosai]
MITIGVAVFFQLFYTAYFFVTHFVSMRPLKCRIHTKGSNQETENRTAT